MLLKVLDPSHRDISLASVSFFLLNCKHWASPHLTVECLRNIGLVNVIGEWEDAGVSLSNLCSPISRISPLRYLESWFCAQAVSTSQMEPDLAVVWNAQAYPCLRSELCQLSDGFQWGYCHPPEVTSVLCSGLGSLSPIQSLTWPQAIYLICILLNHLKREAHGDADLVPAKGQGRAYVTQGTVSASTTAHHSPGTVVGWQTLLWNSYLLQKCMLLLFHFVHCMDGCCSDQQFNGLSASLSNRPSLKQQAWWGRFLTSTSSSSMESASVT